MGTIFGASGFDQNLVRFEIDIGKLRLQNKGHGRILCTCTYNTYIM